MSHQKKEAKKCIAYCPSNIAARFVCINATCQYYIQNQVNSFICADDQCKSCSLNHLNCKLYKVSSLHSQIMEKKAKTDKENQKSFKTYEKVYDEAIQRIKKDKQELFNQTMNQIGLNQYDITFLRLIKTKQLKQITGRNITSKVHKNISLQVNFIASQTDVLKKKAKLQKQLYQIFDKLDMMKLQAVIIQSKIIPETGVLSKFFTNKIKNFKLLYRGSQNNFSTKKFHKRCDGIPHTITLVETPQGYLFGGYTPLKWDQSKTFIADPQAQSFLFSYNQGKKYRISDIPFKKQKAIFCQSDSGPTFGQGYDLAIKNGKTGHTCNFAHTYSKDAPLDNPNNQSGLLIGKINNSKSFDIKEYEVFQVQFVCDAKKSTKTWTSYVKGAVSSVGAVTSWVKKWF